MLNTNRLLIKNENLIEPIINLVKCNLCKNILNDPYDCLCCNLTYCYTCIGEYIIKNKKCPNTLQDESSEEDYYCKLKPSTLNITNFLNKMTYSCTYKMNGCNEELEYNSITLHELCCTYGKQENLRDSINRSSSIVSFKNKNENNADSLENNKNSDTHLNDKLDRIMDQLHHMKSSMTDFNRLSICTPGNEYITETPKFSVGFNSRHDSASYMRNKYSFSNNTFFNQHINTHQEQHKIFMELESMNEKISRLENKLDSLCEDRLVKKIEEKCITNILSKLEGNIISRNKIIPSQYSTINQSSVNYTLNTHSTKISTPNSPPKDKITKKTETKSMLGSPPGVKKIMIKSKVESKPNIVSSPLNKNNSSPKDNPRKNSYNKNQSNSSDIKDNINNAEKSNIPHNQSKFDEINDHLKTILNKMDVHMITINHSNDTNREQIKEYLQSDFSKELKNCFLEITLDSYSVYIDKIEEMFKRLN